jgi:hypothetical protein
MHSLLLWQHAERLLGLGKKGRHGPGPSRLPPPFTQTHCRGVYVGGGSALDPWSMNLEELGVCVEEVVLG